MSAVAPGQAFGALPLPDGVEALVLHVTVGPLTALRARPAGLARGTAVLLPGFTGSKEDFLELLPVLAARGWDVWAYSQRGQADSTAPALVTSYGAADFARDAVEVAQLLAAQTGQRPHLLGHSFGGTVAQAAVVLEPAAFTDLTLLCSGPHGWPGRHDDLRLRLLGADGVDLWRLENPGRADVPDAELSVPDRFLRLRSERTSVEHLLGAIDVLADPTDTTGAVAATALPVLVAHGVEDDVWPQDWQRRAATHLGAEYAVIPLAGHLPNQENPVGTADLLDRFWTTGHLTGHDDTARPR